MLSKYLKVNFSNVLKFPRRKYSLDYIPGGIENNVLWLSYYQMTGKRNDECFRLRDLTTSDEWDIGRLNGYVDHQQVLKLLNGNTGLAPKIYNNTFAAGATDAIQTNVANMPIVAQAGNFNHDGFRFVAASSNYMEITKYNAINILSPILNIYTNEYGVNVGYSICINTSTFNDMQYGAYTSELSGTKQLNTLGSARIASVLYPPSEKTLVCWNSKSGGGLSININGNIVTGAYGADTMAANSVYIGCRNNLGSVSSYLNGQLKTVSISIDNLYNYYNILAARC